MLKSKSETLVLNDNQSSFDENLIVSCETAELDAQSSELIIMNEAYFIALEKKITDKISV